jgi:cytoskeletal protein CcmA (bactofilin family)
MFEKNAKPYTNRIVEGTIIRGDIESIADFRLDGHLVGNFISKEKLVVGPTGSVTGDIKCKNVDVEGKVKGKIDVHELLNLKASAAIQGEVICGKLSVEPGAEFTASCSMRTATKTETAPQLANA